MNEIINNIDTKLAILKNKDTQIELTSGYVVAFIHPISKEFIFLANCANIANICYAEYPQLPGTKNIKLAKIYPDLESIKADIYLLRYHHREFLRILTVAKPALHFHAELDLNLLDSEMSLYTLGELTDTNLSEHLGD